MSRIKSDNTQPEIRVRSFLHKNGFRFTLRNSALPGKPDIMLRKYKTIVFVHGCFWHHCPHCKSGRFPKSNIAYWKAKILKNCERDIKNIMILKKMEWNVLVVWECQTLCVESLAVALKPLVERKKTEKELI